MSQLFPKTTLEQWRVLQAIVEYGGYAQAAAALFRSQSSISYTVAKLQEQLGVALLEQDGRRMRLTQSGKALLHDARPLLEASFRLESRALSHSQGWEAEVRLAVDVLFPTTVLLQAMKCFSLQCAQTRIQLHEEVHSGVEDLLHEGMVDLAVADRVPHGFSGDWLMNADFTAVVAPGHPLLDIHRPLAAADLRQHAQVVVRDTGLRHPHDGGHLDVQQRWLVSNLVTAVEIVRSGLAYAWLPSHRIAGDLARGTLRALPLKTGQQRYGSLYLVMPVAEHAAPACRALADCLKQGAANLFAPTI